MASLSIDDRGAVMTALLQLCTWHAAEAIKKRLIKAGTYPVEIRKELMALIWAWIKSPTIEQLNERRRTLLNKLHDSEKVCCCVEVEV